MTDIYIADLCNEKHAEDRRRIDKCELENSRLHSRVDDVIVAVNGKFTKLYYFFLATLASSLGGTLIIIFTIMTKGK